MRRILTICTVISLLCGCNSASKIDDVAMSLRESILSSNGVSFCATITADYEDVLYTFELECVEDQQGNVSFTVKEPNSISGITGLISENQYALSFDDKILAFPPLADDQLTPVIAPYLFMNGLRGGYISACAREGDGYSVVVDDTFQETPLQLYIVMNSNGIPYYAEIIYANLRILSLDIENFAIL